MMVAALAVFFQKTRIGRALRAVADSHKAALSVGIPLEQIWVIVWFAAGIVALATGIMWGARSDVSFALQIIALKALPVLILGGFTSIPGAIVGGLIIGVGEKLGEFYWGPLLGGGIESWLAYVIALVFLLFRPQGLFGETHHRADLRAQCSTAKPASSRRATPPTWRSSRSVQDRIGIAVILLVAFVVVPLLGSDFLLNAMMIPFLVFSLAAIGLNILTGYAGLLSLGTGAFMGVGAYACYKLTTIFPDVNIIVLDRRLGLLLGRGRRRCSACRRCASRASTSRSRRSPRSSSCSGASSACPGSTTTTPRARSRCRRARSSASPITGPNATPLTRYFVRAGHRRRDDLVRLEPRARPHRPHRGWRCATWTSPPS